MSKWRLETTDSQTEKEILGFSATYLVVLLQFHVGETNSTTSQSPQTKDFPMM
ncbi:hypothetical protein E2C01_031980 [Portunus trituberculatus]|uniref:Uncharacterized protein n=1 Tax=Portunus trituberculatus TaxID=210409 RepID=A0A5B7F1K1_PORTR|nr:hypothetical protein [Portunus trituberculatus]